MRKWVLLTDPDDKMAGVKVRATWKDIMEVIPREFCHILANLFIVQIKIQRVQ